MSENKTGTNAPWYRHIYRWGQTNLTEIDPQECDIGFWKKYWKETRTQGVIVNAGGIVAYYPSEFKLQYRAATLGTRDLLGEFVAAARQEGLAVLARMDINRATEDFYLAHPDWFVVDTQGRPHTSGGRYFSCVNSGYYKEYIPAVMREIIEKYHPDGFTDNSWAGVSRSVICHCDNCRKKFKADKGMELPDKEDWNDPTYFAWIRWSYNCRTENWALLDRVTTEAGGPDCMWMGMVNANPVNAAGAFCDLAEVGKRSKYIMCDHQSRDGFSGFEQNALNGALLHGVLGEDKIIAESMANYVRGIRAFRRGSNPQKETQMWMISGYAGGISPWFHHVGALQEDRRQFENAPPVMQWHEENQEYLYDRLPVANVGIVWSRNNIDFYGRGNAHEKIELPWYGFTRALTRARIPFLPVEIGSIPQKPDEIDVLVLPELAALSDAQCEAIERFVLAGGSLVLTGATGTLDENGKPREKFAFEKLTGISRTGTEGADGNVSSNWEIYDAHNYFRLPKARHEVFKGFEDTDILPFGGLLQHVEAHGDIKPIATYIPAFPIYPPEFSWMRQPVTDIPVVLAGEHEAGGRVVYIAGDVDRCYGRAQLSDHGDLLANAVRWAVKEELPIRVEGPGYLVCRLYRQGDRLIAHIVNLSGCDVPGYLEEYLPVGPITVSIKADGLKPASASLKVSGQAVAPKMKGNWTTVRIEKLVSHELIVLE